MPWVLFCVFSRKANLKFKKISTKNNKKTKKRNKRNIENSFHRIRRRRKEEEKKHFFPLIFLLISFFFFFFLSSFSSSFTGWFHLLRWKSVWNRFFLTTASVYWQRWWRHQAFASSAARSTSGRWTEYRFPDSSHFSWKIKTKNY